MLATDRPFQGEVTGPIGSLLFMKVHAEGIRSPVCGSHGWKRRAKIYKRSTKFPWSSKAYSKAFLSLKPVKALGLRANTDKDSYYYVRHRAGSNSGSLGILRALEDTEGGIEIRNFQREGRRRILMDQELDTELIIRTNAEQPGNSTILKIRLENSERLRKAIWATVWLWISAAMDNWA
ncbi:hypothetical protein B0H13DRAFT_1883434 [Mycena leptocephala]|nr:hypothetical protein B0H13DRAFT_1883434 [Mycena leptocephala]